MEYLIKTKSIGGMTEEQFFQFCQENDSIHLERNACGDIIVMEPTGSETGRHTLSIGTELSLWNRKAKLGVVFDSNTGFTLPNNAVRSPDAAFIFRSRYNALPETDRKKFAHVCPDFIIELLSETDQEQVCQRKMKEWIDNGCKLAWMINPHRKETSIYRHNGEIESKGFHEALSGEDVLPGFELNVGAIFNDA
jgi:Uma2 family endonuclease